MPFLISDDKIKMQQAEKGGKRMPYTIEDLKTIIVPIAQRFGVAGVSLFGSYSKGTANSESDVDLIIDKGNLKSLYALSGFRLALEDELKLPVDIVTSSSEDREFLNSVLKDEVLLYRTA